MKVKEFVDKYNKLATSRMKEDYIKENIKIIEYIPFVKKDALAEKLVDISTYEYKDYMDESGKSSRKKTDKIKVNSVVQYLLFCRIIIENYTDLEIETEGFYKEYDLLKQSGLLDKLMVGTDTAAPLIPQSEIAEFRAILDMKAKDEIFNQTEVHNYVNSLVERFGDIIDVLAKPVMDKIMEQMDQTGENADDVENDSFLEVVK